MKTEACHRFLAAFVSVAHYGSSEGRCESDELNLLCSKHDYSHDHPLHFHHSHFLHFTGYRFYYHSSLFLFIVEAAGIFLVPELFVWPLSSFVEVVFASCVSSLAEISIGAFNILSYILRL